MHRLAGQWSRYVNMNSCNSCRGCRSAVLSVEHWSVTCSVGYIERERERENNSSILPTLSETFFFPSALFNRVHGAQWQQSIFLGGGLLCLGGGSKRKTLASLSFFVRLKIGKHWEWCKSNLCSFCLRGENRTCVFVRFCLGGVGWANNVHIHLHLRTYVTLRYCSFFCTCTLAQKEQSRLNDLIWRYVRTWQWCWEAMLLDLPKRSLLCQDLSVTGKTHWRCGFGHEGSRKESFFGMHFTQNTQ